MIMAHGMEIVISMADNGYIIRTGCVTLVFTDKETFMGELSSYLDNPRAVYEQYEKLYRPKRLGTMPEERAAGMGLSAPQTTQSPR